MTTFTVHAAKTNLSRLIEQALRGEEVVIARGDKPVVRLVPVEAPVPRRRFGSLKGRLEVPDSFFDPLPEDELKLWEGDG
jgi:prevent-host-death family protein